MLSKFGMQDIANSHPDESSADGMFDRQLARLSGTCLSNCDMAPESNHAGPPPLSVLELMQVEDEDCFIIF